MKLYRGFILLIIMLLYCANPSVAQGTHNGFTIVNDNLVLYIDLKLKKAEIDSLLLVADIKGQSYDNLMHSNYTALQKDGWLIKTVNKNLLMLSKPLDEAVKTQQIPPLFLTPQNIAGKQPGYPADINYGINKFYKTSVHELPAGQTRFFLRGNLRARVVLLSGSFNNWNTSKGLMHKTDSGWIADMKLDAGQYLYKFIVNGRWVTDADNQLKEADGYNGYNSIYYRYNYTFKLAGYAKAARVMVAGSFNNFNANEIVMLKRSMVWQATLYLKPTVHTYRFMIDGHWLPDPANPNIQPDGKGNINSVLQLGPAYTFKLAGFANAHNVFVAGDFNDFKTGELRLKRIGNSWQLKMPLNPGNYGYRFIVDGHWITDPANPCRYGDAQHQNSLLVVKPNYTFVLKGENNAKIVRLSGTFNGWDENGYTMVHAANQWAISLHLKPGKQLYKFISDGNWITDPGNKLWEQNQYGTGNSVLWIE